MAVAHLEVKIFTRSKGHSAVLKAAYRAGATLYDERLGLTWNYERKRHVDESFIIAPEAAPEWVYDRERLWNTVEKHERLPDSQLARELEISLPRELTHEQQKALVESFIFEHFVSRGMVADIAIHRPPAANERTETGEIGEDHEHNPHAHVMLTMRELTAEGFARRKNRDWNDWNLKANTRPAWELAANRALEAAGRCERIDMRSFADRGSELEPQPKLYRSTDEAHLDGRERVLEQNVAVQRTARRNGKRLIARPEIVLELLEGRQAVFTEHQILRAINRYTADAEQFEHARSAVFASAELVELRSDQEGPRRFSTRATLAAEQALLANGQALAHHAGHPVSLAAINQAITSSKRPLTTEQSAAVRHLAASPDLAILQGYAGSGKSTMLDAARAAWESEGYVVVGGALAGKAAESLADPESPGISSRTLAAWQWAWDHGRDLLTDKHILVIDEAGMVGTKQLESILATARARGAKVVLVGDTRQLQAIDPGAPMRVLQDQIGAVRLTNIIRQDLDWQKQASKDFGDGNAARALQTYVEQGRTHQLSTSEEAQHALIQRWAQGRREQPADTNLILAYRRKDVHALNQLARARRKEAGELGADHAIETANGPRKFAAGDRLYFLKNDRELEVKNGTLATIERIEGSVMTVRLDKGREFSFDARAYRDIDLGYAATIHKSQGVTVHRTYVLASKYLNASASYVAMSRHRKDANLFYSAEEFSNSAELVKKLSVQRGNTMALDDAPRLPTPTELERAERAELAFLALAPEKQHDQLEKWKVAGDRTELSPADVLERLPEVQAAAQVSQKAISERTLAAQAIRRLHEELPEATEANSAQHRTLTAEWRAANDKVRAAEQALSALRGNPDQQERARRVAIRHNLAIRQARQRWAWGQELVRRQERDALLWDFADAVNDKRGDYAFRIATVADEGKSFEVALKRSVGGEDVFILSSPADASFILADGRLFRHPPAIGTSAVLLGHVHLNREPKGVEHAHTRTRPRER